MPPAAATDVQALGHILLVTEDAVLARELSPALQQAGMRVVHVPEADEAPTHIRSGGFDLTLLDLTLSATCCRSGLLTRLRTAAPDSEVILLTPPAHIEQALRALQCDAFAYVTTPVEHAGLLALVQRALRQVSLRRERSGLARELADSEALYRSVVDSVQELILGIDAEDRILFASRHTVQVTAYDAAALRRMPVGRLCADADAETGLRTALEAARRQGQAVEAHLALRRRDGQVRNIRWTLMPLRGAATQVSVLAAGLDVTRRLELEGRAAQNEAMVAMGTLTASLAHEIRNPLNAAKLQLELLQRGLNKGTVRQNGSRLQERVEVVRQELGRLTRMLDDFLGLARPRRLNRQPFPLWPLLSEVRTLQAPLAYSENVHLTIERSAGLAELEMDADRTKIKQVLINLVGNALDALRHRGHGHIQLRAARLSNQDIEVQVADDGEGIHGVNADSLFEPFVSTKEAGTGLGLAVVKHIIELHGGRVALSSRAAGGTVASFRIPQREPQG